MAPGGVTRLGSLDPTTVETELDPKFKGTGKALLGQQVQLKGDTVQTKGSHDAPERSTGAVAGTE